MTAKMLLERIVGSLGGDAIARHAMERRVKRLAQSLRTLISERGEASGAAIARRAVALYLGLDAEARLRFFLELAREFAPDRDAVLAAAQAYHADPSPDHLERLQRVAEPARQEVFRRMNMASGGTAAILGLRRELLAHLKDHSELAAVDRDLSHLLGSWFNRGFLELRRIDWNTPAAILEKLIDFEAVHEIQGFPDLKRRLASDRRCFAFFHPALKDEPLIFVEVALSAEMPSQVGPILSLDSAIGDARRARCAVFYSITSCQPGLKGISFGNFLIKQVAEDLHAELPAVKQFVTLSPVPGFRAWVRRRLPQIESEPRMDGEGAQRDRESLEALAAYYLTREWHDGLAADAVARFHLGNGARLERIDWMADASPKGVAQSFGLMVNYAYDLAEVERNHEQYVNHRHVACSGTVERLAKAGEALLLQESPRAQERSREMRT